MNDSTHLARWSLRILLAWIGVCASLPSDAFKPEVGDSLENFAVVQAGGQPVDWKALTGDSRIVIFGASWCEPCQMLKAILPIELKRLRSEGVKVDALFVEVDSFDGAAQHVAPGPNGLGYITLVPDPKRFDLPHENPRGIRDWGPFLISGYPSAFLLDADNRVIGRYRGGSNSGGAFADARAVVASAPRLASADAAAPVPTPRAAPETATLERQHAAKAATRATHATSGTATAVEDELLGLWKMTITGATIAAPLYLRVVNVDPANRDATLDASLSRKLSAWVPVPATCECAHKPLVIRLTTQISAQVTVKEQDDGSFEGVIVYPGQHRKVRPVRFDRVDTNDVEL